MTTEFSEYQPDNNAPVQVYASTNPYMRHALKLFDIAFFRNPEDAPNKKASDIPQSEIAFHFDHLMPIVLKDLRYMPADKIMRTWANLFFWHQSQSGLIPIEAKYGKRREYTGEYHFSISQEFQTILNEGTVTQELIETFHDDRGNIFPLEINNSEITTIENGIWRIATSVGGHNYVDITYIIKYVKGGIQSGEAEDHLDVYAEWVRQNRDDNSNAWRFSFYGILEGHDTSVVKSLYAMPEFLSWLTADFSLDDGRRLMDACIKWANAFKQVSHPANVRGHVAGQWVLYNFVHTGLRLGEVLPPPDRFYVENNSKRVASLDFEKMLRYSLEGVPDSMHVRAHDYGVVALAFENLTNITGDNTYAEFARRINEGMWNARPNSDTYLMASDTILWGPVLGDFGATMTSAQKYQAGTDALYWGFNMFEAYRLAGGTVRHDLRPPRGLLDALGRLLDPFDRFLNLRRLIEPWLFQDNIKQRKTRLKTLGLLDDNNFPGKYLGMALGLTLDWIKYAWRPEYNHFVNRLSYDGCWHNNEIGSDSKYNTLSMLVYAYSFSHDEFYMDIFDKAWGKYRELAGDARLGGFFPERVVGGELVEEVVPEVEEEVVKINTCWDLGMNVGDQWVKRDPSQSFFLDILIRAWQATVDAGRPRENYLIEAREFANRIIAIAEANCERAEGMPFLRLALASGTLRRIHFTLWEDVEALVIIDSDQGSFTIKRNDDDSVFREAVIYMNAGRYQVNYRRQDDTESEWLEFEVSGMTTSVYIYSDRLEIGEEGFA